MFKRDLRIPDLFFHYLATFVLFEFHICLFRHSSGKMVTNSLTVSMLWRIFKTGFMAFNSSIQILTSNIECWFYSKFNFIVVSCIWEHTTLAITRTIVHSQESHQDLFAKKCEGHYLLFPRGIPILYVSITPIRQAIQVLSL